MSYELLLLFFNSFKLRYTHKYTYIYIATDKHLEHILEKKSTKSMGGAFPHLEHAQTHT